MSKRKVAPMHPVDQLLLGVRKRKYALISRAVRRGADTNHKDLFGYTPFMYACGRMEDMRGVELMLKCGADPMLSDDYGFNAFDYAAKNPMCAEEVKSILIDWQLKTAERAY